MASVYGSIFLKTLLAGLTFIAVISMILFLSVPLVSLFQDNPNISFFLFLVIFITVFFSTLFIAGWLVRHFIILFENKKEPKPQQTIKMSKAVASLVSQWIQLFLINIVIFCSIALVALFLMLITTLISNGPELNPLVVIAIFITAMTWYMICSVWWGFSSYIIISREEKASQALAFSRELSRGLFFPVLWKIFLFTLLVTFLNVLAALLINPSIYAGLALLFCLFVGIPFNLAYFYSLYSALIARAPIKSTKPWVNQSLAFVGFLALISLLGTSLVFFPAS
jgi:hypothetical protein